MTTLPCSLKHHWSNLSRLTQPIEAILPLEDLRTLAPLIGLLEAEVPTRALRIRLGSKTGQRSLNSDHLRQMACLAPRQGSVPRALQNPR